MQQPWQGFPARLTFSRWTGYNNSMGKVKTKKLRRGGKALLALLCIFIGLPLFWIADSLVGCFDPASFIPDSYIVRLTIPNPPRFIDGILAHESLSEIINLPAMAASASLLSAMRDNALVKNPLLRFAAKGALEGALLAEEAGVDTAASPFIAAWDAGLCTPLLRFLPLAFRFIKPANLYHVQAGKFSWFEYRMEGGNTLFIKPQRNLLVFSSDRRLFESALSARRSATVFQTRTAGAAVYDATLSVSPAFLSGILSQQNPAIASVLGNMEFQGPVEAGVSLSSRKLEFLLTSAAASPVPALGHILEQRSRIPGIAERLPATAQYGTILSAGTLAELYAAAAVFSGPELGESLRQADRSARAILGMSLDDLLFSWTGTEFAVFGMEGRPHPVYAVQIGNEQKRQEIFGRAFKTIMLNENTRLNLDGVRIPRIETPEFLQALLRRWNFRIPSPCYTVYEGYLLVSESADTLLSAVRAMQKNDILPKTAVWRSLAGTGPDVSAFSLYYSLDRSLPFFLRGNTAASGFLGVYRQGLIRLGFDRGAVRLSLSLIPGSGSGLALMSGYPLALGGNPLNRVYGMNTAKGGESRILVSQDGSAVAINPADNSIRELEGQGQVWLIPAEGIGVKSAEAAWVVNMQGRVTLVNGNMEPMRGFPLLTGLRLSSPPASYGGRLFLCDEDGKVYTVDSKGALAAWETVFPAAIRSPPSFLALPKTNRTLAAVYPKSFFGEIWVLDAEGRPMPNWPAPVSGIAFGTPLLFSHNSRPLAAFVTQAGELSVFDENAASLPLFPINLDGVFYLQPVFDGEYLWLASADGTLFRVSPGGETLSQRIPGFSVMEEGNILLFDTDGDSIPEVFVSGEGNALHGYSRNFRSLEGFPLPVWGRPLFADLNGDGKAECTGVGMDRLLYRWQFK